MDTSSKISSSGGVNLVSKGSPGSGKRYYESNMIIGFVEFSREGYKILALFDNLPLKGGFQLLDLIIPELKNHVIPYKFKSSHWLKLQHSDWRANLVKDFFLQMNFPPMNL